MPPRSETITCDSDLRMLIVYFSLVVLGAVDRLKSPRSRIRNIYTCAIKRILVHCIRRLFHIAQNFIPVMRQLLSHITSILETIALLGMAIRLKESAMLGRSFRIMNFLGVPIALHITWFPIFALLVWLFSDSYFGGMLPHLSSWECMGFGVLAALSLYLSLLVHESGHCLVARWYGMHITQITLFLFGCAAQIHREPPTPKSEFLITIAGPIVSAVIAFSFLTIAVFFSTSPSWGVFSLLLALLNLNVALFNLLPIFPLDGGRVLRAGLWAWSKNLHQATRFAVRAGQGITVLLVSAVFWMVKDWWTNLWFLLFGTFLFAMAQYCLRGVQLKKAISRLDTSSPCVARRP